MMRLFGGYRQLRARRLGAGLAVLALCFGLAVQAWTPQVVFPAPDTDLATLFGEHALCLAAAHGEAPADPGHDQPAPSHDHHLCCLFHANFGFPPRWAPSAPALLALAGTVAPPPDAAVLTPRLPTGAARARAPPPTA
jgi:hypothetical protein